ncbi:hypothetical protein MKZ38_001660 [Zalerion maritima]|uniref:Uncharacterized protein n=1 Tax=Zalerion maritima TaxID=339359 RepID=A0AAD5RQ19_9PEZI|nr:hypothetical protein MKZ38_001660 [Zalerion maritima]
MSAPILQPPEMPPLPWGNHTGLSSRASPDREESAEPSRKRSFSSRVALQGSVRSLRKFSEGILEKTKKDARQDQNPDGSDKVGSIQYPELDYADLDTEGRKSKQGRDLLVSTNVLGAHLLTKLLVPALEAAASADGVEEGKTRVLFTSSVGLWFLILYAGTKTANWFLAKHWGDGFSKGGKGEEQGKGNGVLAMTLNPGNLKTPITDEIPIMQKAILMICHRPRMGAYTMLFSGLSRELGMEDQGGYVIPWGRRHFAPRQDILDSMKSKEDGGTGLSRDFWEWCEREVERHL